MTVTSANPVVAAPVITIDGPTASGKGTVAHRVAKALGWDVLDSGALYRLTALAAMRQGVAAEDEPAVARVAETLDVRFDGPHVYLEGGDVGHEIRREEVGNFASRVAAFPGVRRCWSASGLSVCRRAWWPTGATWARWCSPMRPSRYSWWPTWSRGRRGGVSS